MQSRTDIFTMAQHVAEAMASLSDAQDVITNGQAAGNLADNINHVNRHLIRLQELLLNENPEDYLRGTLYVGPCSLDDDGAD